MRSVTAHLSKREKEVINLAAMGLLDKEITVRLGISENTLKTYWKRIRSKLGEGPKPGLIAEYLRQQGPRSDSTDILFGSDWIYDYRSRVWSTTSERPLPAGIVIDGPVSLDEVLSYFHPEDALALNDLVERLATNDVDDFFFRARIMAATGVVQTSTFVHVIRNASGQPITLLGHRSLFHDLAPMPPQDLMVGYWEQDVSSGEFTVNLNLVFALTETGQESKIGDTKYTIISADELDEIRALVQRTLEEKGSHGRKTHRLGAGSQPFQWATIDAIIEHDSEGRGRRAHGSVLAFG